MGKRALIAAGTILLAASAAAVDGEKPNHLVREKSPYLLQHAHNPVDWYPWGEEAFSKARRENKPIFLSIGYATCHWCHVMERESYSNPEVAAVLNKYFVAIKVDREERPDVDRLYMALAEGAGWGGGWPLNLWLTPSLRPFYGGTYFPPRARWGRPGLIDAARDLGEAWKTQDAKISASGDALVKEMSLAIRSDVSAGPLDPGALDAGYAAFAAAYDGVHGGLRGAPKFPMPLNYNFLLRYYARTSNNKALEMTVVSLRHMADGGVYDQLGGGFHRYSTDGRWHVPHFEKMLYDNAQLAVNYLEAYEIVKDTDLARVARETLDYVRREMTAPGGGFYSAEDADSRRPDESGYGEGAFYVWEKAEVLRRLGGEAGGIFCTRYGVEANGNAESDPQGEFANKNILFAARTVPEVAEKSGKTSREAAAILGEAKRILFSARSGRPRPAKDDKILTAWNGLMISAFAKASQILGDPEDLKTAERSARFLRAHLYDAKTHRLYRRWRDGERKVPGNSDDYAFLVQGLLDLYEASFDVEWVKWAVELTEEQNKLFYDPKDGGFFMTPSEGGDRELLLRSKVDSDDVEPSASSVAASNLLRLSQYAGRADWRRAAEKTLTAFGRQMKERPQSLPQMLVALDYALSTPRQIVIAGDPGAADTREMLERLRSRFIPNKIVILADGAAGQAAFARWLPTVEGMTRVQGKATAYVCINFACNLPTSDPTHFGILLDDAVRKERPK